MIYWKLETITQFIASLIWNASEYFKIPLGKFAPIVFGFMMKRKPNKKINKV